MSSVSFILTKYQKAELRKLGHDDAAIKGMKPEDGHEILRKAGIDLQPATVGNGGDHRFELPDIPAIARLKSRKQWVAWKSVPHEVAGKKPKKVPINLRTGRFGAVDDPDSWGTYDQALTRARRDDLDGIGFVLTADDCLTGYDLDSVVDPTTGVIDPWAAEIVALAESYTEITPSGKGLRIFAEGKVAQATKFDPASVEIYGDGRFLTLTGRHLTGTPTDIQPAPKTLAALLERVETMRPAPTPRPPRDPNAEQSVWQEINTEALDNLDKWVSELFPKAKKRHVEKGYRITSKMLGRNLEEDISISMDR